MYSVVGKGHNIVKHFNGNANRHVRYTINHFLNRHVLTDKELHGKRYITATISCQQYCGANMLKDFIAKLKDEGWTQEAIAEKVGVRQNQISTLAKGGDCKASTLLKFAKAFNISIDEIVGFKEKAKKPLSNCQRDNNQTITQK